MTTSLQFEQFPDKPTGTVWNFYPTTPEELKTAILAQGPFLGMSDVSNFASVLVRIIAKQQEQIDYLQGVIMGREQ